MNKFFLALIILFFSSLLFAQEKVDLEIIEKIKDEEAQHSQIPMLAHFLTDVCGPRLTNSPGYMRAVEWTVHTMKQWGLQNAAPEPWGEFGKGWSNEETYLAMKLPYYRPLIAYPAAWTNSTLGLISAKVILVDKLDSASIEMVGTDIKGSIVMVKVPDTTTIPTPFKADAYRFNDAELNNLPDIYMATTQQNNENKRFINNLYDMRRYLELKGAVALLYTSSKMGRNGTVRAMGLLSYHKDYKPILPEVFISIEDYLSFQRMLSSGLNIVLNMKIQNKWYDNDLTGYNVIAEIPGTDPILKNQVVMLGGHLDSWHGGTGATDNAAGCIVMMEAVRILKALAIQPRRTIRIALWSGEEQGLLGSFGYVKKHFGNPKDMKLTSEQAGVSVYFNLDNGTGKIRGIYLQNNEQIRNVFSTWLQPFADMGANGIARSSTGATDHLSFDAVGIPAFQFIQDPMEYRTRTHHTNMDVYDHLFMDDLKQAAIIVTSFVYNAAMRNELLPRKPLPNPEPFLFENGDVK